MGVAKYFSAVVDCLVDLTQGAAYITRIEKKLPELLATIRDQLQPLGELCQPQTLALLITAPRKSGLTLEREQPCKGLISTSHVRVSLLHSELEIEAKELACVIYKDAL